MKSKYYIQYLISIVLLLFAVLIGVNNNCATSVAANVRTYQSNQPFDHVHIGIVDANVNIKQGKQFRAYFPTNYHIITFRNQDHYLYIEQKNHGVRKHVKLSSPKPTITITVPNKDAIKKLDLGLDDGQVTLNDLSIQQLKINSSDAQYNLQNLAVTQRLRIDNEGGRYQVQNSNLNNVAFDDDDGQYQFDQCHLTNVTTISDGFDDTNLKFKDAVLNGSNINFEDLKMKVTLKNTKLLGQNVFHGDELALALDKGTSDVHLMRKGKLKISFFKRQTIQRLQNNHNKKNVLKIKVTKGTIK